jgi:D-cysteine desulfhydrase family pyridoxal phosphate-dependent enzyme
MPREASQRIYSPEEIRSLLGSIPRVPLAVLPTPLQECKRLSQALHGPQIWMKRDDLTGLALGGNKTRQIEFLMGDVLAQRADVIVAGAGTQSNFCRQLTAAAAKLGLKTYLVLMRGVKGAERQGNLLLDTLMGAEIEIVDEIDSLSLIPHFERTAENLRKQGFRPYIVESRRRSAPLLSIGYVNAMLELLQQLKERDLAIDYLYLSAANMTQAGLELAAKAMDLRFKIVGLSPIQWHEPRPIDIARIANLAADLLGLKLHLDPQQIFNSDGYVGEGYGLPTQEGNAALRLLAQTEGILLDPVYTSKAMAALINDVQSNRLKTGETVLFLHTGGIPALFSYARELTTDL